MNKKLVMHIITGLSTGGAESMLMKLLAYNDDSDFDHMVVALSTCGDIGEKIKRMGIPVEVLKMKGFTSGLIGLFFLAVLIIKNRPSLIQTWMYHADLIGGTIARLVKTVPVVWNIRNSNLSKENTKKSTIAIMNLSAWLSGVVPHAIVSCSHVASNIHVGIGYDKRKMIIIPNGFDADKFKHDEMKRQSLRSQIGIPKTVVVIAHVARYDPQKDHACFINAASILRKRMPNVHYLLCGEDVTWGNCKLRKMIVSFEMQNSFYLLGKRDDIPAILSTSDIVSSSSSYGEAFPNIIGEAMLCKKPCVVTNVGDSASIVGSSGVVVPPNNPEGLATAWYNLINEGKDMMRERGDLGHNIIKENYDIKKIVSIYNDLYINLIKSKS